MCSDIGFALLYCMMSGYVSVYVCISSLLYSPELFMTQ